MTEADLALAREAVACKHWAWMPGMWTLCRVRLTDGGKDWLIGERPGATRDGGGTVDTIDVSGLLPDFGDPATVGCLEALVQRVLGHDGTSVVVEVRWTAGTHRVVRWRHRGHMGWSPTTIGGESHPSKVAALVAALKAAP